MYKKGDLVVISVDYYLSLDPNNRNTITDRCAFVDYDNTVCRVTAVPPEKIAIKLEPLEKVESKYDNQPISYYLWTDKQIVPYTNSIEESEFEKILFGE